MKPAIAILGAGPGGLALARLLETKNIDYIVYERDETSDKEGQGGSLDIHEGSGQQVLKECGLLEKFKSLARYDGQAIKTVDLNCKVIWDKKAEDRGEDAPEIDRKILRQLLLDSVPKEKIVWGAKVDSVERREDGSAVIKFADGTVESGFKLLVGADGTFSKARSLLTSAKPVYSGCAYVGSTISPSNPIYSKYEPILGRGTYMALGPNKSVIVQRMTSGAYNVYFAIKVPEDFQKPENFREQLVTKEYAGWSPEITDLIKYCDEGPLYTWRLYALPADTFPWKSAPDITLIGDAAHVSPPNGEGVNAAMHDSLQLAHAIEKFGLDHLYKAVKEYEEEMFPRAIEHINDGNNMKGMLFAEDSPKPFADWWVAMGQELAS